MKRATVFVRFLALCIDWIILSSFSMLVFIAVFTGYVFGAGGSIFNETNIKFGLLLKTFISSSLVIIAFYFTYLTMKGRATAGKSIFKIKVLKNDGTELGFLRSFFRCAMYVLSASLFFSGFIIAAFMKGKTLHDMLADTQVIEEEL